MIKNFLWFYESFLVASSDFFTYRKIDVRLENSTFYFLQTKVSQQNVLAL